MRTFNNFFLILLSTGLFLTAAVDAQTKKKKTVKKSKVSTIKKTTKKPPLVSDTNLPPRAEDYKIIAQGAQSKLEQPFLFVARDAKTYALLQTLAENLPEAATIDFAKEAVVAAFAGTKPTPGWEVLVRKLSNKTLIDLNEPRKDMMYAQVITTPFKIAVVPVEEEKPLALEATPTWTNKMATYRITKGTFIYSGGLAYRERTYGVEGTVGVMTSGEMVTAAFNLMAKGDKNMFLGEIASGTLKEGKIELSRLDAGTFSENPKPPVNVTGTISDIKMSLRFEPNPTNVDDGFQIRGMIEAAKIK